MSKQFIRKKLETKNVKNIKNKALCLFFIIFLLVGLTKFIYREVDADEDYVLLTNEVCSSNMCNARIERLNKCEGDVQCATQLTLKALEKSLYKDIQKLSVVAKENKDFKSLLLDLLKDNEGLELVAYCDTLSPFTRANGTRGLYKNCNDKKDRWSIGYGTRSYPGETITADEAELRMLSELANNFIPLLKGSEKCNYNEWQKASIVDFYYNAGAGYLKPFVDKCDYKNILYYMNPNLYAGGLKDRRANQRTYFLTK